MAQPAIRWFDSIHLFGYGITTTEAPSTIIIDEPELGLHPYAITLLGAFLRSASKRMQVIVSTQSVSLVNEFSINDLIIVEREQGQRFSSVIRKRNSKLG